MNNYTSQSPEHRGGIRTDLARIIGPKPRVSIP